jgi:putative FmdB family regulatory protein
MPIYEYRCADGHVTERLELLSKKVDSVPCPNCGAVAFKQISRTSFGIKELNKFGDIRTYTP